jgi:hypothetical protein
LIGSSTESSFLSKVLGFIATTVSLPEVMGLPPFE